LTNKITKYETDELEDSNISPEAYATNV